MTANQLLRLALGFWLGPAVGLVLLTIVWCGLAPIRQSFSLCWSGGAAILMIGGIGAFFAYPATLLFGVPLFIAFRRRGWLQWWQVGVGGIAVGVLSTIAFIVYAGALSEVFTYLPLFCGVGVASALIFWAIAVFRNSALTMRRSPTP
jgi:hypothetical protein